MQPQVPGRKWEGDKLPRNYRMNQYANYDPQQMELYGQGFDLVGPDSYLSRLAAGDQSFFEEMEKPAFRQLAEAQGGLGSRFASMGMGGLKSSGFKNMANAQAMDMAMRLQGQRQQLRQQAIKDLHGISQDILGRRPYERFISNRPEKKEWLGQIAPLIADIKEGSLDNSMNFLQNLMHFA